MQKKLIALAIAGAFVAPAAALADGNVTIYGIMDASFDVVDSGTSTAGNPGNRQNRISSNSSRIGFKGTEDLGNGLTAVWQIESSINADGGGVGAATTTGAGTTFDTRNTFVGLSSKTMGTVVMGRHDTPYKLATRSLDVFADGIADNRSIMGGGLSAAGAGTGVGSFAQFDGRQSNVLAYISPTLNGFTAAVGYVTFENAAAFNTATTADNQDNAWSAMVNYGNGPWYGALAYERHNADNMAGASGAEEHAWKLGVGYKANALRVGLAYENTGDNLAAGGDAMGHHAWYLAGGYTFGNNEVKLAFTRAGDMGNTANTGADQWAVGIDHNFSKRTKVYALYTKLNNDSAVAYNLFGGSNGGTLASAAGADPSAWSFGLKHSF